MNRALEGNQKIKLNAEKTNLISNVVLQDLPSQGHFQISKDNTYSYINESIRSSQLQTINKTA